MSTIHTLHILNKVPEHPRSAACQQALMPGDALLLIENAVLALATAGSELLTMTSVYALTPDVMARGLENRIGKANLVDFPAMVKLTAQAQKVISW
jgi:tRNA 2-thiouridine synthesizing protein B